jgi:hypothetical protein
VGRVEVAGVAGQGRPGAEVVTITGGEAELAEAGGVPPMSPRFAMPTRRVPEGGPNATEVLLAMREDDRL